MLPLFIFELVFWGQIAAFVLGLLGCAHLDLEIWVGGRTIEGVLSIACRGGNED
jgi:hypothetical protein